MCVFSIHYCYTNIRTWFIDVGTWFSRLVHSSYGEIWCHRSITIGCFHLSTSTVDAERVLLYCKRRLRFNKGTLSGVLKPQWKNISNSQGQNTHISLIYLAHIMERNAYTFRLRASSGAFEYVSLLFHLAQALKRLRDIFDFFSSHFLSRKICIKTGMEQLLSSPQPSLFSFQLVAKNTSESKSLWA